MPIRFRCAYCNQLMGISRRKAGQIVRCPKCSGQVVVPTTENAPAEEQVSSPGAGLEDPNLEKLLTGAAQEAAEAAAKVPKPKPFVRRAPSLMEEVDVEPVDLSAQAPATAPLPSPAPFPRNPTESVSVKSTDGSVVLPRWVLFGAATLILLLMGLAFLVGLLLGRSSANAAKEENTTSLIHVLRHG